MNTTERLKQFRRDLYDHTLHGRVEKLECAVITLAKAQLDSKRDFMRLASDGSYRRMDNKFDAE